MSIFARLQIARFRKFCTMPHPARAKVDGDEQTSMKLRPGTNRLTTE